LAITGTAANEMLNVTFNGTSITNFAGGTVTNVEAVKADLGAGTDTLDYGTTTAAVTVDLSAGKASGFTSIAGIQNVTGGAGNNTLTGNGAANVLTGGAGNDTLSGCAGNDTLKGGLGNDTLTGGAGNDTFVFDQNFGHDRVTAFDDNAINHDALDFALALFANFAAVRAASTQVGTDVHIDHDLANGIVLMNYALANLTADDLRFH